MAVFASRACTAIAGAGNAPYLRISAIVDAYFSLIVDGETASFRARRGGAQALGWNVAQSSTISLKPTAVRAVPGLVLGLSFPLLIGPLPGRRRRPDRACIHVRSSASSLIS